MFDTAVLINYGTLGIWTAYLLWEKNKITAKFIEAIDKNTIAVENLLIVSENIHGKNNER